MRDEDRDAQEPVERCSCSEAEAYKAALEELSNFNDHRCMGTRLGPLCPGECDCFTEVRTLAREALARAVDELPAPVLSSASARERGS